MITDLIIEHCRKNHISWQRLGDIADWEYEYVREILEGKVDDKAFCELKEIAETLAVKHINKLRYNRIKAMMAIHHTRAYDLADYLGVHPQTVSSWATNARQPRLDELYAIAGFFRCCPTELMG